VKRTARDGGCELNRDGERVVRNNIANKNIAIPGS
jgi:hypothetical protein